jgi:hypothetical protein
MNSENLESFIISNPSDNNAPTDIQVDQVLSSYPNDIASEEIVSASNKKSYSIVQKKKIADRVENLKSKKHFKEIFKIIYKQSSNCYTKDSTGVYINFNILSNETLKEVEDFLNIISPKNDLIPLPAKYIPYFLEDFNPKDSGIKLSNHEKNFLKYVGNDSDSKNNFIESESSLRLSEQNKPTIVIKPFTID